MNHCHYYPERVATYYCPSCQIYTCDDCSKEVSTVSCRCFTCGGELESLGTGAAAEPFWRRLDKTFRYALNSEVLIFISTVAVFGTLLLFLPGLMTKAMFFLLMGAFVKYCFSCLESTAMGDMKPPRVSDAYQDGLGALLQLILVFIIIGLMCALAFKFLGLNLGMLISVALICALPASIISLAMGDSVLSAVNPLQLWRIISAIGLAYGVLLGFILIMSSSVAVISSFLTDGFSLIGLMAQNFVSNFYTVVMFHMMGYMIFQYQSNLGFTARDDHRDRKVRSDVQKAKAHANMLIREGEFTDAADVYAKAFQKNLRDLNFAKHYFDYLIAIRDKKLLSAFGNKYIALLIDSGRASEACTAHKQIAHMVPKFKLASANLRYSLAKECYKLGDGVHTVQILNGLHKDMPDFEHLPEAYLMCAKVLDDMNKPKQASKFRNYSNMLVQKQAQAEKQRMQRLKRALVSKDASTQSAKNKRNQPAQTNQPQDNTRTGGAQSASEGSLSASGGLSGLSLVPLDEHS